MNSNYNSKSFHFRPTNHQNIDKEFIRSPNRKGQLKIFYCQQRMSVHFENSIYKGITQNISIMNSLIE